MSKKKIGPGDGGEGPLCRTVILGSGGHARAAIEVLRQCGRIEICGCIAPQDPNGFVSGVPVLGDDDLLMNLLEDGIEFAFVAVGRNDLRRQLSATVLERGMVLINAVSTSAYLAPDVTLGVGVIVMPGAVVRTGAVIGDGAIINSGAVVDHDVSVGAWSHIGPGASVAGNVKIGSGVFLGAGCCVIPDVAVGAWTVAGAGAVVVRDLPNCVLAVGSPARIIRTLVQ